MRNPAATNKLMNNVQLFQMHFEFQVMTTARTLLSYNEFEATGPKTFNYLTMKRGEMRENKWMPTLLS
jgi:hypothetical protein